LRFFQDGTQFAQTIVRHIQGLNCLVHQEYVSESLATLWAQLVPGSMELLTPVNRESRDKGKGKDKSEKVAESAYLLLVTHRCDGAILSDRCGDGLSEVHAQAVRRHIELRTW
jgi:hypothetical protein